MNIGKQLLFAVMYCIVHISVAQTYPTAIKKVNGETIKVTKLNNEIQRIMKTVDMTGLSIAVINDSEVVYHETFGYANAETKEKLTKAHIFEGASLSKPIFAYFVMKMAEKGIIDLDTPLHEYFPHPAIDEGSVAAYKTITARMVLSHSSGFPNFSEGKKIVLPFKPGNGYLYSGEGYQYLAAIVGHLNGVGWRDKFNAIFEKEVLAPLHMKNTSFLWNDHLAKHKVFGHQNGKPTDNGTGGWSGKTFNAFSSIHSDALEYSQFIIAMLKEEGLQKANFDEMLHSENVFEPTNELRTTTGQTAWGLGFSQKPTPNGLMHLHTGNNHDFQSYAMFVPEQQYGLVIFANCDKLLPFLKELNNVLEKQF